MRTWIATATALAIGFFATLASAAEPIVLLPLGDSITAGWNGGYRKPLMELLTQKHGVTVTTVGSQTDEKMPDGQKAHEGHGGWQILGLNDNLLGHKPIDKSSNGGYWLTGGNGTGREPIKPTIVTVMAGINDLGAMIGDGKGPPMSERSDKISQTLQTRYRTLITTLTDTLPEATIFVGGCIPYANGLLDEKKTGATQENRERWAKEDGVASPEQELGVNHWVIGFNKWIKDEYVPELQKAGKHVHYVDVYSRFILPDGKVRGWDNRPPESTNGPAAYADYGLHPNPFGYKLMAEAWAEAIAEHVKK